MRFIRNFSNALTVVESVVKCVTLRDGTKMPMVGLGTFDMLNPLPIYEAISSGYRMIDTAIPHKNEDEIGWVLKRHFYTKRYPIGREDLFIISKLPNNGHRCVDYFVKSSLHTLQLDYFDLYLIQSPFAVKGKKHNDTFRVEDGTLAIDKEADILETWRNMEEAVDAGLVKNIGLSNFNIRQIEHIYDNARIKPANLQVECHPFLPQNRLLQFCQEKNITITAYSPLGAPYFPKMSYRCVLRVDPNFPILLDFPIFSEIGSAYNKTAAQVILRWLTQRGIAVIPKSGRQLHQKENLNIFDFTLSSCDMSAINNIRNRYRIFPMNNLPGLRGHPQHPFEGEPLD